MVWLGTYAVAVSDLIAHLCHAEEPTTLECKTSEIPRLPCFVFPGFLKSPFIGSHKRMEQFIESSADHPRLRLNLDPKICS